MHYRQFYLGSCNSLLQIVSDTLRDTWLYITTIPNARSKNNVQPLYILWESSFTLVYVNLTLTLHLIDMWLLYHQVSRPLIYLHWCDMCFNDTQHYWEGLTLLYHVHMISTGMIRSKLVHLGDCFVIWHNILHTRCIIIIFYQKITINTRVKMNELHLLKIKDDCCRSIKITYSSNFEQWTVIILVSILPTIEPVLDSR